MIANRTDCGRCIIGGGLKIKTEVVKVVWGQFDAFRIVRGWSID